VVTKKRVIANEYGSELCLIIFFDKRQPKERRLSLSLLKRILKRRTVLSVGKTFKVCSFLVNNLLWGQLKSTMN